MEELGPGGRIRGSWMTIWELGVLLLGSLGVPLGLALTSGSDFWPPKGGGVPSSSLPQCGYSSFSFSVEGVGQKPQQGPSSCPTALCCPLLPTANGSRPPQALLGSDTWILAIVFWPLRPLVRQQITARQIFLNYHDIWDLAQFSWLGVQTGDRLPGAVPVLPLVTSMTFGRLCDLEQVG